MFQLIYRYSLLYTSYFYNEKLIQVKSFQWLNHIRMQIHCPLNSWAASSSILQFSFFICTSGVTGREVWREYTAPLYIQIKRQWRQIRHEKIILKRMGKQQQSKWNTNRLPRLAALCMCILRRCELKYSDENLAKRNMRYKKQIQRHK